MGNRHTIVTLIAVTSMLALTACGKRDAETPDLAVDNAGQVANTEQPVALARTASPTDARVFFITPADGDTVSSPVNIEFGIDAMSIVAAGDNQPRSGHHHLLVNADLPELGLPIPADANHIHFGDASTSTELELAPGEYSLRLLLGDYLHIPHDPPVVSDPITVTVE